MIPIANYFIGILIPAKDSQSLINVQLIAQYEDNHPGKIATIFCPDDRSGKLALIFEVSENLQESKKKRKNE